MYVNNLAQCLFWWVKMGPYLSANGVGLPSLLGLD
jgi:hypothetical protein